MSKALKILAGAVFGVLALLLVIGMATKDSAPKVQEPPVVVSSVQLSRDYEANSVAADLRYKGKRLKVTGRVEAINTDFAGDPVVAMDGANMFLLPQFAFGKRNADQLAKVRKGQMLTVICTGRGDVIKAPISGDCQVE